MQRSKDMTLTNPNDEDGVMLWNYVFNAAAANGIKCLKPDLGAKVPNLWSVGIDMKGLAFCWHI